MGLRNASFLRKPLVSLHFRRPGRSDLSNQHAVGARTGATSPTFMVLILISANPWLIRRIWSQNGETMNSSDHFRSRK